MKRGRGAASLGRGERNRRQPVWMELIPAREWLVYQRAIRVVRATGLPFMLGGGFALAVHIDHWRNTKDIDFYILPKDRHRIARALADAGFVDYHDQLPYDRGWIHRSFREGVIVDLIWSMANRCAAVDLSWLEHARPIALRNEVVRVLPVEELLWCKLYVLQRDHCDWPDVMNLLHATGHSLDWSRLLERVTPDLQLLGSALALFEWLNPRRAIQLPAHVRRLFGLRRPTRNSSAQERRRARLLDSRGWFAPLLHKRAPLEV